jgi:hypothetical protein
MDIDVTAQKIVKAILEDVTDRRGWRQEWDMFDESIQEEIRATWLKEVTKILARQIR